jgi:hypothetical protein
MELFFAFFFLCHCCHCVAGSRLCFSRGSTGPATRRPNNPFICLSRWPKLCYLITERERGKRSKGAIAASVRLVGSTRINYWIKFMGLWRKVAGSAHKKPGSRTTSNRWAIDFIKKNQRHSFIGLRWLCLGYPRVSLIITIFIKES